MMHLLTIACMIKDIIMLKIENKFLKLEQYKIESESFFNGNCVPELSTLVPVITTQEAFKTEQCTSFNV